MKIEYCEGCTTYGTYIDDKPLAHFTVEELQNMVREIVDSVDDIYVFQEFFSELAMNQGTYEDLGICEQCGDTVGRYTYYAGNKKKQE